MRKIFLLLSGLCSLCLVSCGSGGGLLQPGDPIPDVSGVTSDGQVLSLRSFTGKSNVVLYFYPKDNTPGCTKQACALRDSYGEIRELGAEIIGVSTDDGASHRAFAEEHRIPFPLLADTDQSIVKAFGVPTTLGMARRVTFILGREGTIRFVYPAVNVGSHDRDVVRDLLTLQGRSDTL